MQGFSLNYSRQLFDKLIVEALVFVMPFQVGPPLAETKVKNIEKF